MSHELDASHAPPTLGGYALQALLGRGGMGEVWRAERVGPGGVRRRAAVKRILAAHRNDGVLRARFLAEARISAQLEHPNVVQVLDFGDAPELYLVLEFVEGVSLADLMRGAALGVAPLPVEAAVFIVAEAARGLDYAHRRCDEAGRSLEIVHRDVSPPNVLVSVDGAVKVSDFGVARARDNTLRTLAGAPPGKLAYMAPEQAAGGTVNHRADVFALGVVLWEALTLRPLLPRGAPGETLAALASCSFAPPSKHRPEVSPALDAAVLAALAREPERRTASAGELAEQLRAVLRALHPGFDAPELARVVRQLVPDHPARPSATPPLPAAPAAPRAPSHPTLPARPLATKAPELARAAAPEVPVTRQAALERVLPAAATARGVVPERRRRWLVALALLLALAAVGVSLVAAASAPALEEPARRWLEAIAQQCAAQPSAHGAHGALELRGAWPLYGPAGTLHIDAVPDDAGTQWVRTCLVETLARSAGGDGDVRHLEGVEVHF